LIRVTFWKKQAIQQELQKSVGKSQGMTTALLSDVRPDETSGTIHFKITAAMIQQIFLEKPSVKKMYHQTVPHKVFSSFLFSNSIFHIIIIHNLFSFLLDDF
jgi:hypothetical protein